MKSIKNFTLLCFLLLLAIATSASLGAETSQSPKTNDRRDVDMLKYAGTYKFEKDDGNFDALLTQTGVSFFIRKIVLVLSPTVDFLVNEDGSYTIKATTTFKNSQIDFKLNEQFEEKRMDGRTVKTTIRKDGNKLIQIQETEPKLEITREFTGDKLIVTSKCNGVTNVREYKKV